MSLLESKALIRVMHEPLSLDETTKFIEDDTVGALSYFVGKAIVMELAIFSLSSHVCSQVPLEITSKVRGF
jgi:hypothetical protein